MEIADVRAYALSSPIDPPQERSFYGGTRRLVKRDVVLVVIESTEAYRGVATAGATSSEMREYFQGDSQSTFADVITGAVADALKGETIDRISDAHDHIDDIDLPQSLREEAISAVDIALHDLRGRISETPLYELLAAEYETEPTTEIPLYASAGMYMEPDGYVQQAKRLERLGFYGYKYRPGIGPEGDRQTVERLATETEDIEVMLDVHTWWKLRDSYGHSTVTDLVTHAGDHGAYWVEEPVSPDDHAGYVELAETGTPLAGGESEPSPEGLLELGRTGAVDFLQGDVRHHRGFKGCRKAVEYCVGRDVEFVPHNFGTWLGLIANAHLVAAAPEVRLLEYPVFEDDPVLHAVGGDPGMYPFALAFDILAGEPAIDDGILTVPDGPGLGIEIDFDVIEKYPFKEGPWTEFHYTDQ